MNDVILVAVNDSPAGFAATDVAIEYAHRLGATLHAVTVVDPTLPDLGTDQSPDLPTTEEPTVDSDAMLRHVVSRGTAAGVPVTTHRRAGAVAAEILRAATDLGAGLLILGLVDQPNRAMPYIGSQTLRVLEFATVPVLVVPVVAVPVVAR